MRRKLLTGALGVLLTAVIVGCGGTRTIVRTVTVRAPALSTGRCEPAPGEGVMGVCTPKAKGRSAPRLGTSTGPGTLPDVSEYNGCALYSEAIVRIYEAGTGRIDTAASCHLAELHRKGAWVGVYFFARPSPGCYAQADRFVGIARYLSARPNVYVIDAEVWLPGGFVSCLAHRIRTDVPGSAIVTYTATGTWPGGPLVTPWWAASYGARPGCLPNTCSYLAWQFSESANCRGVFGDCSIDYGITKLGRVAPPPKPGETRAQKTRHLHDLEHRRLVARRWLEAYGCAARRRHHSHVGPRCRAKFAEGDRIVAAIVRYRSEGIR